MRSELVKLALGCVFATAVVAPALACDYYHSMSVKSDQTTVQTDQTTVQSQQTPDSPQTAESQPAADTGSN
jgi:hypothetical protein